MITDPARVLASWEWQTEDAILIPYLNCSKFAFPEDFLVQLYFQVKAEGLTDLVFPSYPDGLTLNQAIKSLESKPIIVGLTKPDYNVAGVGWLYEVEGQDGARKASIGFLFFRKEHGRKVVRAIARLALRWWFDGLKCDVLYGTCLSSNKVAINFSKRMGFRICGQLPMFCLRNGALEDATLLVQTKDEYLAREQLLDDGSRKD